MQTDPVLAAVGSFTAAVVAGGALGCLHAADRAIKRSDVVFMGNKGVEVTKVYGGTVVSWGGRAWGDTPKAIQSHVTRVKAIRALGVRYSVGAAFRTAFRQMIDFDPRFMDSVCRRLDGEPILVPWLWDQKHKDGHPAYWFCTNAPGYRKYLKHQIKLAVSTDVDGLHIDDYLGTAGTEWSGGCFCRHCVAAFREYLSAHVSADRLKACGVTTLKGFDYGGFLRSKGITVDQYRRRVGSTVPLGPEFLTFQYRSAADWVAECRRYAEGLVGHALMLSVNSSGSTYKSLVIAPHLSYFCGEVSHGAAAGGVPRPLPVWNFKLADALGKAQAATGSGQDWAYINEHKRPGLVRVWIAQDYAFGHQLMAPHRQWAYTKTKGTHWYQSTPADYAHLYRFVRRHAELFDGYEAAATVALLYSNPAMRRNKQAAKQACYWLAEHNIPFHIVIAGDAWLDVRLTAETLGRYAALVVAEPSCLEGEQRQALEAFARAGKVVAWDAKRQSVDAEALAKLVPRQVTVTGAKHVLAVPRVLSGKLAGPAVVHLLNRNYDPQTDAVATQRDVTLVLDRSLFDNARFSKATLYAAPQTFDEKDPGASNSLPLELVHTGATLTVRIPVLTLWGIVKLQR